MSGQPAGTYEVLMWWTYLSTRSTSVRIDINHAGGTSTIFVNQQQNGGQWNSLGIFEFNSTGSVTITATSSSTISACADAVWYKQFAGPIPTEIIVDNRSAVTSQTGTWSVSSAPNPYGVDSVWGRSGATFTWYATLPQEGTYDVYMWWTQTSTRPTSALVTIQYGGGSDSININQQQNGGQWNLLGRYTFAKTGSSFVRLSAPAASPISYGADAVKFNFIELNNAPVAFIDAIEPSPAGVGDTVYFDGHGEDSDGNIAAYNWESDIDGELSSEESFATADLSEGEHIITFKVQDDKGKWSAPATEPLVVGNVPPTAFIDSITPNPALVGQTITLTGHGEDSDGTVEAYQWHSSIDGNLSNEESFSTNLLSIGGHTITFTVYDNNGVASVPVSRTLTVQNLANDVIIDNGGSGTSSTGTWSVSGGTGFYGVNSVWARNGATYTWTFSPAISGYYQLYMWWTQYSSRSNNIPVDIQHIGGPSRVYINQQQNGSKWNSLGEYPFQSGSSYRITITAASGSTVSTCADAVKFVYNRELDVNTLPPTATIDSINPNPAVPGEPITFVGHGTDISGTITAYNWRSDISGNLSNSSTFSTSSLSAGLHTIFFKVQNNRGMWSSEVSRTLSVGVENIYCCFGYGPENDRSMIRSYLDDIAEYQGNNVWVYRDQGRGKTYVVRYVEDIESMKNALKTEGSHVLFYGHSNYGLGPSFATTLESQNQEIDDIRYIDDDRIFNVSSPWVHINVNGMRTSQAYPYWWPIFKDGTSGRMPYTLDDPNGLPAYNYYVTYQVLGDPNHYRIETVRNSAIVRFFDSSVPAWYSPDGRAPDTNDPNERKYYIVNSASWSPSFETTGDWTASQATAGYFKEDYFYTSAGTGDKQARWLFTIPTAGTYKVLGWWPASNGNTSGASYVINYSAGSITIPANQQVNGGRWNELGEFYFEPNAYSVTLSNNAFSGNVIADGVRISHPDNPPEVMQADFCASARSGNRPLMITFYNRSTGDLTSRRWNFGDGFTNTTRDTIDHTYNVAGKYTVSLTVSGPLGSSSKTKVGYIVVGNAAPAAPPVPPLQAEFAASAYGAAPLRVRFSDLSSGDLRRGITYKPAPGYAGQDTFSYVVKDDDGATSNEAIVRINPPNQAPVANDDWAVTAAGVPIQVSVLSNDTDVDGNIDSNTVVVTLQPSNGTAVVNAGGKITYTPNSGFGGTDTFRYTVKDIAGAVSNDANVTINPPNRAPVAKDDSAVTDQNTPVTINVVANDKDSDGNIDPNTVTIKLGPTGGTVTVNEGGKVTYTPGPEFSGTDSFTYTVADKAGAVSNDANVTINPPNRPPVANDDRAVTQPNVPVTVNVLANDTDADGTIDSGTIEVTQAPSHGTFVVHDSWLWDFGDGSTSHERGPTHTYLTPGNYTVTLTVTDANGDSVSETKVNFVRAVIFEKSIDNVDYPKTHTAGKVVVYRKELEIPKEELKYNRLFWYSCNSGNYYLDTFNRGVVFYTLNLTNMSGGKVFYLYLKAYFEGRSNQQMWQILQDKEAVFDYYDFSKRPQNQ
jgi:PKD repeat protein